VQFSHAHDNESFAVGHFAVRARTTKPLLCIWAALPCKVARGNESFSRSGVGVDRLIFQIVRVQMQKTF
jgi:hypothetical protein